MFSNLWAVVSALALAQRDGRTPIVDFSGGIAASARSRGGSGDGWTDYFEPVSAISLGDVPASADISYIEGRTNIFPTEDYGILPEYRRIFRSSVTLNETTQHFVGMWLDILSAHGTVLGIHARGTDMRVAKSHRSPPEIHQLVSVLDQALERAHFDSLFVATEDERALNALSRRYGDKVFTSDSFRTKTQSKVSQMASSVMEWRYLTGLQVIRDAWLLGHCHGLVSGSSNVAEHAEAINQDQYVVNLKIRRPRVDVLGSHKFTIRVTNKLRWLVTSRIPGKDFEVIDRRP